MPPVIIPPARSPFSDESLDQLAALLDDIFHIPGTKIRFGLDPLLGLIPGIGDALTGIVSLLIVLAAWRRGLPKITIARMLANIAIDTAAGAVPVLGDAFDFLWKSNRMNMKLLKRSRYPERRHTASDWLFFAMLFLILAALTALPFVVLGFLFHLLTPEWQARWL